MHTKFVVEGVPRAKARHRSYMDKRGQIKTYTPANTVSWENYIGLIAKRYAPEELFDGPIKLKVLFYMEIPKSWGVRKKELAMMQKIFPTVKPDLDNMLKLVKDSLNNIIWKDDKQVVCSTEAKFYSNNPRTEISVDVIE